MYERFTDRARKVMSLANQSAQEHGQEQVATEHILLGICKEEGGVAARIMKDISLSRSELQEDIENAMHPLKRQVTAMGRLPHSPPAKRVVELAITEAREMGHNYVGTEHLLMGLLLEEEGVAARTLTARGLTTPGVREAIRQLVPGKQTMVAGLPDLLGHRKFHAVIRRVADDDAEDAVADEKWLRTAGMSTCESNTAWIESKVSPDGMELSYYTGTARESHLSRWVLSNRTDDEMRLPHVLTRGQVRQLCSALGIPLAGVAKVAPGG